MAISTVSLSHPKFATLPVMATPGKPARNRCQRGRKRSRSPHQPRQSLAQGISHGASRRFAHGIRFRRRRRRPPRRRSASFRLPHRSRPLQRIRRAPSRASRPFDQQRQKWPFPHCAPPTVFSKALPTPSTRKASPRSFIRARPRSMICFARPRPRALRFS